MHHSPRLTRFALATALSAAFAASPFGCADDALKGTTTGTTLSSSSGAGGTCSPTPVPCVLAFTYPFHNETSVVLRGDFAADGWTAGVPMSLDGAAWKTSIEAPNGQKIHYKFFVDDKSWVTDPNNSMMEPDATGNQNSVVVASCAQTTCMTGSGGSSSSTGAGGGLPAGAYDWRSAVLYFVFVDRFNNGDKANDAPVQNIEGPANYQGGDYAGVLQKINEGYFEKLGVTALWLTVPMDNADGGGIGSDGHMYSAYHGYWPTNLEQTEEKFGSLADLKAVVDAAHKHGLKVLFDYAMNHVHKDAPVYAQHNDWFWPLDYNGKHCVCGQGCDWNDAYEQKRCWFTDYLPDWNFTNDAARKFSVDNALFWIKQTGIDGFRLDAVKHIETSWITDLRARVSSEIEPGSKQHFYMVGETFESGNRDLIKSYVDPKAKLDGQFDFPLRGALVENILRRTGSMMDLEGFVQSNDHYYDPGLMSTFLGNHDLARMIQTALDQPWGAWDNGGNANWSSPPGLPGNRAPFERVATAFTFLLTSPGIPLIYYGDEIGMPGAGDPDNRRFMQWDGYSPDQLFLRGRIEKLGAIRKAHSALWKGARATLSVAQDTYAYSMTDGGDVVYVALNRGDQANGVDGLPAKGRDLLSDVDVAGPTVTLPPRSAMVIVAK